MLKFLPKYIKYCDNILGIQVLFVFCSQCQPRNVEMMRKMKDTKTIKILPFNLCSFIVPTFPVDVGEEREGEGAKKRIIRI